MCCRVIKEELNERMRNEMKRIVTPSSLPFDRIIINFYNMMFSNIQFWSHINLNETKSSHETLSIKTLILKKFGKDALTEKELNPRQYVILSLVLEHTILNFNKNFVILFFPTKFRCESILKTLFVKF